MTYQIVECGVSRSFPSPHAFLDAAGGGAAMVLIGSDAGRQYVNSSSDYQAAPFVAIELNTECLGIYTGEPDDEMQGANVLGFARFRLGDAEPSQLIELVRQPGTDPVALNAARQAFENAGLKVAVCQDVPGRIVNRLVRPYYNAALRRLDEKLASAADLDKTLELGLGYPEGPIRLLNRTGLQHHYDVSMALFQALGDSAFCPARRAQVANARVKGVLS